MTSSAQDLTKISKELFLTSHLFHSKSKRRNSPNRQFKNFTTEEIAQQYTVKIQVTLERKMTTAVVFSF